MSFALPLEVGCNCKRVHFLVEWDGMVDGIVWCGVFTVFFLWFLCSYLWYNETTSVSNGCIVGISLWMLYLLLLYCCHNHFILVVGMVVIYLLVSLYMWVLSFCVSMVHLSVSMSLSGWDMYSWTMKKVTRMRVVEQIIWASIVDPHERLQW